MSSTSIHYLIPVILLLVAVLYASLGLVAWRRRPALAVTPFAWLMLAMGEWSLGYALEFLAPGLAAKTLLAKVEYFGIVSLPVFWLAFALEYTGRRSWLTWRNWAALWLIPLLTLGLAWTNDWHGLIWKQVWIDTTGKFPVWMSVHGAWFWAFTAYSYLLLLAGTLLVGWEMVRTPALYRSQAGVILLGAISPWAGNAIYLSGASPLPGLDLTPFAFIPTGLALLWGITRYGLLEIVPPAHDVILQHLHDGVLVVDWRGRTLYLNPVAERIFNLSADQAIGQPVQEFFPSYPELMVGQPGEEERRVELPLAVEGKSRFFDVHISPVYTSARRRKPDRVGAAQKPSHLVLFYDIQQRKQAETALKHRDAILQAVSLAAEKFLRMEAWEQSTPEVLEQLGRAAEASRVYIFERHLTEDGTPLVSQRYEWVAAGIAAQIDNPDLQNLAYRAAGFERWDEAFMQRQAVFGLVGDFPKAEKELLSVQDILSIAVMPIFAEEEYWGFIGFDECHFERVWTNTELEALRAAADIFGAALARNRAEAILHNRRRSLNLLHEIIHEALQTPDLQSMTQALVDRLGELIGADGCFLTLWDEKARKVVPMAAYGPFRDTYRSLVIGSGEKTFTTSVLEAGHPLVIEDAFHSSYISPRLAAKFSARSMLILPLITGENKLGAILLGFNSPHHFSEDEIDLGEQAAGLIALTLAKFRAVEQAYQRAEESETLRKAGSLVAATLDPQEAVSRILEQLEQVVPHDSASVQLLRDGELEIVGGRGWPEPASVIGIRFPVPGDNPNSIVIQTRQPYVLDETDKVYPTFRRPPHSHIRSWLGVPLIVRNEVTGLLAIDSAEPHHFTSEHVQMATAFADQVAITLENTRLFGSAQRQAKRQAVLLQLSTDLAVALDEQDICKRAVHNLHDMLGFDYVSVFLVDEDSGDRVLQVGIGLPDQFIPERMPPGRGISERPLLDGQLHYTPDVTQESNYIPGNNGSEVDVPIRIGEEVKGVLIVESARLHAFSQNDCDVLNTAANIVGLALTRAWIFTTEHRQFDELAVMHATAMAMTEAKSVDELLERTTQLIGEKLFPDNFGLLLLDETAGVLRLHSTYRLIHAEQFSVPVVPVGQGITGMVVKTGQPRRVADVSKDPDYIIFESRIQSEICVPLKIGGQVIGVINAESVKLNAFTLADEHLLTTLASQLAIGIERLRAVDEIYQQTTKLARSNALISALAQVATRVSAVPDPGSVMATLGSELKRLGLTCLIALHVPDAPDEVIIRYTSADPKTVRLVERAAQRKMHEFRIPAESFLLHIEKADQPSLVRDPISATAIFLFGFPKPMLERILKSFDLDENTITCHLPLIATDQMIGFIWLWGGSLREADLPTMSVFASQVAVAIENARLYEEQQHRLRDLALLHEISKNVSASLDLGEVLNRVVQGAVEAVGADAASLNLLVEAGQARMMVSVGLSERFKARTDVRPGGTTMTVIRTRQPLLIPDVTQQPDLVKPIVLKEGIKSFIVLPLPGRERIMGAMFVLWRREHVFSDDEVRLLMTFANQAALGIENARLFAEVQNLAITDPLTGLYNRRGLFELGRLEFARTRRFGRPFASMMLDIDRFKRVNDTYGHPVGDQVLQTLAKHCQGSVREIDLVARYGGEEFVILLPETNLEVAEEVAERLRKTIAQTPIPTDAGGLNVTISAGVAMYDKNTPDLETLIARADQAMYVAKHKGRNRIAISR